MNLRWNVGSNKEDLIRKIYQLDTFQSAKLIVLRKT